jgi:hypothetical protein
VRRLARSRRRKQETWSVGDVVTYPIKRLDLTLLIHRDVWPDRDFSSRPTTLRAVASPRCPIRAGLRRLSFNARALRCVADDEALRASAVPDYAKIVRHLTAQVGWRLEDSSGRPMFRKISFEVAYPLHGSQIMLVPSRSQRSFTMVRFVVPAGLSSRRK